MSLSRMMSGLPATSTTTISIDADLLTGLLNACAGTIDEAAVDILTKSARVSTSVAYTTILYAMYVAWITSSSTIDFADVLAMVAVCNCMKPSSKITMDGKITAKSAKFANFIAPNVKASVASVMLSFLSTTSQKTGLTSSAVNQRQEALALIRSCQGIPSGVVASCAPRVARTVWAKFTENRGAIESSDSIIRAVLNETKSGSLITQALSVNSTYPQYARCAMTISPILTGPIVLKSVQPPDQPKDEGATRKFSDTMVDQRVNDNLSLRWNAGDQTHAEALYAPVAAAIIDEVCNFLGQALMAMSNSKHFKWWLGCDQDSTQEPARRGVVIQAVRSSLAADKSQLLLVAQHDLVSRSGNTPPAPANPTSGKAPRTGGGSSAAGGGNGGQGTQSELWGMAS